MYNTIRINRDGGVAVVTINRPEKLNILSRGVITELSLAAKALAVEEGVRIVVLTGAGGRAFSAGVDVHEMKDLDPKGAKEFITLLHQMILAYRSMDPVVIAAIAGYCLGGALELAMACDLRIASENSQLGMPEIQAGIPSVIEACLMSLLMGEGRARELILLGHTVNARDAEKMGLINRMVPGDTLQEAVQEICGKLLSYSPTALRWQKRILNRWLPSDLEEAMAYSIEAFSQCFATAEPHEAMTAFLEKRPPRFGAGT